MEEVSGNKPKEISKHSGKPMSEEELAEYNQTWIDIEESIAMVEKSSNCKEVEL